ncbi:hypothetical protein [Pediococcus argentinicus]|nr:hypothetical protein [Pediococcus argentinicus]GEP19474.1 hypothetical protein LSA03_08580 [Pediococcus argentinicus]
MKLVDTKHVTITVQKNTKKEFWQGVLGTIIIAGIVWFFVK